MIIQYPIGCRLWQRRVCVAHSRKEYFREWICESKFCIALNMASINLSFYLVLWPYHFAADWSIPYFGAWAAATFCVKKGVMPLFTHLNPRHLCALAFNLCMYQLIWKNLWNTCLHLIDLISFPLPNIWVGLVTVFFLCHVTA